MPQDNRDTTVLMLLLTLLAIASLSVAQPAPQPADTLQAAVDTTAADLDTLTGDTLSMQAMAVPADTIAMPQDTTQIMQLAEPEPVRTPEPVYIPPSLFADKRAFRLGDVVTILLVEHASGSNSAQTDADMRHDFKLSNQTTGVLDFIPGLGMDAGVDSELRNRGLSSRSGSLTGKISARIMEIMPNSDLKIEGRRTVNINGEEQITVLSGIVRAADIRADNTVYSYLIADAAISYKGKGDVNDAARPGIISRFLGWLF